MIADDDASCGQKEEMVIMLRTGETVIVMYKGRCGWWVGKRAGPCAGA